MEKGVLPDPNASDSDTADVEDEEEEREVAALEREVKEMGEKIIHYRSTVPQRAVEALELSLVAQRPVLSGAHDLGLRGSASAEEGSGRIHENDDQPGSSRQETILNTDKEVLEKLHVFRTKSSKIVELLPGVLKRMNNCIARIDRICQQNVTVHSVFKRQRRCNM